MRYKKAAFWVVCSILVACSPTKDLNLSARQVERFHQQYSAGQDDDAYRAASPLFHRAVNYQQWLSLRSQVRKRLGKVQSAQRQSFKEWLIDGNHMIEVVYQTKFESGIGSEKFTWQLDEAGAKLAGYYITLPLS